MKQTIKTSRVAGQLEKMFRALNNRFFDGEPDYLGEAPNMGVSDYWFGRIFPHSYIVRGGTDDGKYYMQSLEGRRGTALRNQHKLCQFKSGVRVSRWCISP